TPDCLRAVGVPANRTHPLASPRCGIGPAITTRSTAHWDGNRFASEYMRATPLHGGQRLHRALRRIKRDSYQRKLAQASRMVSGRASAAVANCQCWGEVT